MPKRESHITSEIRVHSPTPQQVVDLIPALHPTLLKMLVVVIEICKRNRISYQLNSGTLLGAIRHKGFIPWDDDLDVAMLRSDYERFIVAAERELGNGYFLQSHKTDPLNPFGFVKIRKNNSLFVEQAYHDWSFHHGIYIDIFPMDNLPNNYFVRRCYFGAMRIARRLSIQAKRSVASKTSVRTNKGLRKLVITAFNQVSKLIPIRVINDLYHGLFRMFEKTKTNMVYIGWLCNTVEGQRRYTMMRCDVSDVIEWEFEGLPVKVPIGYDRILTNLYGDYMRLPVAEEQVPSHPIVEFYLSKEAEQKSRTS